MNEQAIQDAYNLFVSNGYQKSLADFKKLIATNPQALQDSYNLFVSNGYGKDINEYKTLMGVGAPAPVKKKEATELSSAGGSSVSLISDKYRQPQAIQRDATYVKPPITPMGGPKPVDLTTVPTLKPTPPKPKPVDETPKEQPYFTGALGETLSALDGPSNPLGWMGIGDFIDDMGRAIGAGFTQGDVTTPSNILLAKGRSATPEQIKKYVAAAKDLERLGASEEMMQFSKIYQEEGSGVYGFLKGLALNPGVIGELMISSTAAMLNPSSAAAAGTVTGGFAASGAATGAAAGGVGAAPGAVAGAIASVPWAIGAAGTALETGLTFSELLQEKLKEQNLEFTEENVKKLLENEAVVNSIRAKSVARGATIGVIDGLTGRLAGKVGANLAKGTAASKVKAGLAAGGIEMAGGSTGEAAGRVVAGQELDVAEIGLEGISEGPMAIADVTAEVLKRPIYEVNGERRNEADVQFLIDNASPDELYQMDIKIKNDVKGYGNKIQEIVVDNQLKKEIKQANPNADDATVNELLGLEKELQKFENNKTQSGKDRAAQIRSQIKAIQENAIQKQSTDEGLLRGQGPEVGLQKMGEGDKGLEVAAQEVKKEEVGPKYVKDISVLITPATVRGFDETTTRMKEMSVKYDELVKKYNETKDEALIADIRGLEEQILNDTKQEIIDKVATVPGTKVAFKDHKMGSWDGKFEPAFNMTLSVTPQADTKKLSDMLFDFSEKYSQDAFILESDSDNQESVFNDTMDLPLTEEKNGLIYYPQIGYTFATPVSREKQAELSNKLKENGIDAFNMNDNEVKVSVISFVDDNLSPEEKYKLKQDEYKRQSTAIATAVKEVLGPDALGGRDVKIRRSKYTGATNEGSADQTRTYDRGDVFEAFQNAPTEVENLAKEYNALRQKQIDLSQEKKQLTAEEQDRLDELAALVQPTVEKTFEVNKQLYEDAKVEAERIAVEATRGLDAFISGFPIKRPSRASIKTMRWYGGFTEKLGDGARLNIIVNNPADVDKVYNEINSKYPAAEPQLRRINDKTDLGYPKRLIEVRTSNGVIAEMQVMTPQAYLAKDGVNGFQGQQDFAKAELKNIQDKLGWSIPDGLGHYFYEIQRDLNVDEALRSEATALSNKYYEAFTNPEATLPESFMDEVAAFKEKVDSADKTNWDRGNEGNAPESLEAYLEARPKAQVATEDVLTADNTDKTTLEKTLAFLDKVEKDLDAFGRGNLSMGVAIPVMKAIIKTMKALVKTGITLQEAIARAAAENNVSEQAVIDTIKAVAEMGIREGRAEAATEMELPGYNRMQKELQGIIEKSRERGTTEEKAMQNAIEYLQKSRVYQDATDVQREQMVRDVRKTFGKREKASPSAARTLGQIKTKVTVDEMAALKDQIKLEARAAREAKGDLNKKRKQLIDVVRKMGTEGKMDVKKVNALVNKIGSLNLDSQTAVDKFLDYAGKVFADAEYASKLSSANTMRKQIRKLSKNKDKAANLRALGSQFSEIDPSMVDDIDAYNKMASMMNESIKGSSIRGKEVKFADIIREDELVPYINKEMEAQRKKLFDMKVAEIQELLGVDASDLNYEQLIDLLAKDKEMPKDNEKLVRSAINKAFDIYSTMIKESIKTGKDLFTGEDVSYAQSQKKVVGQFMNMKLNELTPKEALEAVDGLMNFIQNSSTAKMESVVRSYTGRINAKELADKGIKASPLRKYWSKSLGRFLGEQTTNLNILFEKMFKGFERGGMVEDKSGVTDLKNGKSAGQSEANAIVNDYVKNFYEKKANGEDFNTDLNNVERGMTSFMMRNVIGTEEEMKAEFDRRKNLVSESITELEKGNEQEVEKAKVYQKVYDKILDESNSIEDVTAKVDKTNMDAVKFWQEQWANKYDELADVSLNVYNKILGKDINYNPDKFTNLSTETGTVEIANDDMAFHVNNGTIYKKETGVLMEATRPKSLPKNPKNGEVSMYIDLSFDKNNANAMYDALVDIKTAGPIRQIESFLNSASLKRVVPQAEDAEILKDRISLFVNNIRNKNPYSNDELSKAVRRLNKIAAIGVGQALGGVLQPIKQVIPVAMNTLVNGGGLDLGAVFNPAKNKFINDSGYAIANRGIESQAQIESIDKLIDKAAKSKGAKALQYVEEANRKWLEIFLVKPDVFIARSAWMTYYEQSLKKQGLNPKTIDYNSHEINKEAADYAQRMVDRQQNISDADLAGKLFAGKEPTKQVMIKMLMPFASFRMNQSSRLGADLGTLMSNVSTQEDKKIAARSLAGFGVEMAAFRMISVGSALLINAIVKEIMGRADDEEEDKKKMDAIVKGQLTSTVSDIFSPLPLTDKVVQAGVAGALEKTQDALDVADEDRISIYSGAKQDLVQSLGLFGITADRALQLYDIANLSTSGSFKDDYGREKYLTESDKEALRILIAPALLTNVGLAPSEVNSVVRSSIKDAKRNASTKEGGEKGSSKSGMNKEDMKRYNPELYNQLYGPESPTYEIEQMKSELNKEKERMRREMMDEIYEYTPNKKD